MDKQDLQIHVLFRFNKKSGKVDKTMTALGCAVLQMWALQNTPPTKHCLIFERETGILVFDCEGNKTGFSQINKYTTIQTCNDFNIPLDILREIKDDRFDKN